MIPGTGSGFSGCSTTGVWLLGLTGSGAGVAVAAGAGDAGATGVADCCSIEAVGAMACATGRPAFFVSVLSHAASNRTAGPKITMLKRFTQNSRISKSLPSYLCFDAVSRLRIGHTTRFPCLAITRDLDDKKSPGISPGAFFRTYQLSRRPNWNCRGSKAAVGVPAFV